MKKPIIDNRLRKPKSDRDLRKISIHAKKRFKDGFEFPHSNKELVSWTHGHPGCISSQLEGV